MRLDLRIEGFASETIWLDGDDSTDAIIAIRDSFQVRSVSALLLNGVTFGGMNIADIDKISRVTDTPLICVSKKSPNIKSMIEVVENHQMKTKEKVALLRKLDPVKITLKNGKSVYVNISGTTIESTREILDIQCKSNLVPESIRISHLIGSALGKNKDSRVL